MKPRGAIGSKFDTPGESPGFLLWQVAMLWERRLRAVLQPHDLTHLQLVLLATSAWLGRGGESVTQVRIASHAKVDVMMTSQVLRTLEAKGLIRRRQHPTDTRAKCVVVTVAGRRLVRLAIRAVEREDTAFFTPEALKKPFQAALQALIDDGSPRRRRRSEA